MDDAYYRYPAGSAEHYAAYEKEFIELRGTTFPFPDDPWASYEVDNAYELAYDRYVEDGLREHCAPDDEADWEDGDSHTFRPQDPGIDLEPWLWQTLEGSAGLPANQMTSNGNGRKPTG